MIFGFINITGRTRELGMLRALGLTPLDITRLLYLETLLIASAAVIPAAMLAVPVTWHYELHPIIIKGMAETYRDYGIISDEIPMRFDLLTILWNGAVILGLNMLAVVYPVIIVNRMSPVEAMRHV